MTREGACGACNQVDNLGAASGGDEPEDPASGEAARRFAAPASEQSGRGGQESCLASAASSSDNPSKKDCVELFPVPFVLFPAVLL